MALAGHQQSGLEDGLVLDDFEQFGEFHSLKLLVIANIYNRLSESTEDLTGLVALLARDA